MNFDNELGDYAEHGDYLDETPKGYFGRVEIVRNGTSLKIMLKPDEGCGISIRFLGKDAIIRYRIFEEKVKKISHQTYENYTPDFIYSQCRKFVRDKLNDSLPISMMADLYEQLNNGSRKT